MEMKTVDKVAYSLLVVGGLNWGIVGLFEEDLVSEVFGIDLARVVFVVVGAAAAYVLYTIVKMMSAKKPKAS